MIILLFIICIIVLGMIPLLLTVPLNGLSIWGQVLGFLNIHYQALFIWVILSIALLSISALRKVIKRRALSIRHLKLIARIFLPWIIFLGYLIVNYFVLSRNSINQDYSLNKITLFIIKGITPAFFISVWLILNDKNSPEKIEKAMIGFGIIQSYFVFQSYLAGDIYRRMTFFGLNPIWLAREQGLSVVATFRVLDNKVLKLILGIIFIFSIFLTRSRGPLIGLIITLFFMYSYRLLVNKKYKQLAPSVIVILILIVFLMFSVGMDDYFTRGGASFLEEGNVSSRLRLYNSAWNDFLENPILGKGIGNYYHDGISYPHNIILELLAETGLIGITLFIVALKPQNIFKFKNKFAVYMMFTLLTTVFSGDLEKNAYLIVFSVLVTLLETKERKRQNNDGD